MTGKETPLSRGLCDCATRNPYKLRRYLDSKNELIGTFCNVCGVESLIQEYMNVPDDNANLCPRLNPIKPLTLDDNTAFQVRCTKTEIDLHHFADILKPGDHITWHRPYVIWHHSIVAEVNAEENEIGLIHWTKDNNHIKIISEMFKVNNDKMYRIDYPDNVTKVNDLELVLARAKSRLGDTGYGFFSDNCESFATYCKSGVAKSHQVAWIKAKLHEYVCENVVVAGKMAVKGACKVVQRSASVSKQVLPKVVNEVKGATKVFPAELIERVVKGSNWVGAGIVVLMEGTYVMWDLRQAYKERENGNISRNDFIEVTIQRVIEGLVGSGMTILGSLGPELICASIGPIGIFIGGIVGGIIFGALGKALGTALGSLVGNQISSFFMNDQAVRTIDDLHPADHIVLYGSILHSRCHAIVVEHDGVCNIKVVRNLYMNGVVQEWIPFSQPLYKVCYGRGTCYHPARVLAKAMSRLGEHIYNLVTYNCKTFAIECKSKSTFQEELDDELSCQLDDLNLYTEGVQRPCYPCSHSTDSG